MVRNKPQKRDEKVKKTRKERSVSKKKKKENPQKAKQRQVSAVEDKYWKDPKLSREECIKGIVTELKPINDEGDMDWNIKKWARRLENYEN